MDVLAALGEAPTAAIAVIAILLGLFVVARGRRGERGDEKPAPSLLAVPAAAPASADPPRELETMAVHDVGHGTIRLGGVASPQTDPAEEPDAVQEPAAMAENEPAPSRIPFRHGKIRLRKPPRQ